MSDQPKIGRVQITVDCPCGVEVDFEDVEPEGWTEMACDDCGRVLEVTISASTQVTKPPDYQASPSDLRYAG